MEGTILSLAQFDVWIITVVKGLVEREISSVNLQ